jgi:predicted alpha/beta hydrolase family esterase
MPLDRILLVPRWAGGRDSDFYRWFGAAITEHGWRGELEFISLRPPNAPEINATIAAIRGRLSTPPLASRTLLIGHSVGAQAAMRTLAELPPGVEVAAFLAIAGWWSVDDPWPTIQPWIETPFDWARARTAARRRIVLLSTNDPFTADSAQTGRLFADRLAAEVHIHEGAAHFNAPEEPHVLSAVLDLLA